MVSATCLPLQRGVKLTTAFIAPPHERRFRGPASIQPQRLYARSQGPPKQMQTIVRPQQFCIMVLTAGATTLHSLQSKAAVAKHSSPISTTTMRGTGESCSPPPSGRSTLQEKPPSPSFSMLLTDATQACQSNAYATLSNRVPDTTHALLPPPSCASLHSGLLSRTGRRSMCRCAMA